MMSLAEVVVNRVSSSGVFGGRAAMEGFSHDIGLELSSKHARTLHAARAGGLLPHSRCRPIVHDDGPGKQAFK